MKNHADAAVSNFLAITRGVFYALVASLLLAIILSLILHFTSLPETALPASALVIFIICALWGGLVTARSAGARGLILGLITGALFCGLALLIGLLFPPANFALGAVAQKLFYSVIAGGLGGVLGLGLAG